MMKFPSIKISGILMVDLMEGFVAEPPKIICILMTWIRGMMTTIWEDDSIFIEILKIGDGQSAK